MAEHWDVFFQAAETKGRSAKSGSVKVSSTTDDPQTGLDEAFAARKRHEAATAESIIYTEIPASIQNPDGGTEHSAPWIKTDIRQQDETMPSALEKMSAEERLRSWRAYDAQSDAAKVHYGAAEWENVFDDTPIPQIAVDAIQQLGLRNPTETAHFIATHRQVADELVGLRDQPRRVVRRIQEISYGLQNGQLGADMLAYRQYQARREREIRGRR